jgi:outer membrane protein assembly factor BamE
MSVPIYPVSTSSVFKPRALLRWALPALAVSLLSACGSFSGSSFMTSITPYKAEVVQGNFVSKEQVDALRPGMSRTQVREILGSPLLTSVFHGDRWDYVFTIRRQGVDAQARKLAVFFKGDDLEKFEGDTMPTEAEFIATIDTQRKFGKVPELEASEEQLAKTQSSPAQPSAAPASNTPAAPVTYPPLEPAPQ